VTDPSPFTVRDLALEHGGLRVAWVRSSDGGDGAAPVGPRPDVPLLLVHGLSSSHGCWTRTAPTLRARRPDRRVLAVDLPGFGGSAAVGEGYRAEAVADALVAGLDALDVERVDLVGHSLGGLVATVLADRRPDRVRRLVLAAAAGVDPYRGARLAAVGEVADRFMRLRRRYGPGLVARPRARTLMFGTVVADAAALAPADAALMVACSQGATRTAAALDEAMSTDLRPRLARLAAPLGAVWGAQDRLLPAAALAALETARPGAPVRTVDRAGHVPMIERPEAFADALDGVLDLLERSPDTHLP
jgi:pimeloyl-ACP methyl ester carboxylesterase